MIHYETFIKIKYIKNINLLKIKGYIFLEYIIQKKFIYIYINILLYLILVTVLSLYTLRLISLLTSMYLQ